MVGKRGVVCKPPKGVDEMSNISCVDKFMIFLVPRIMLEIYITIATALLKMSLSFSETAISSWRISPFSTSVILSHVIFLSQNKGLTNFQKFLLSVILEGSSLL